MSDKIFERWGEPDLHMAEYWSLDEPIIKKERVLQEYGAAAMGKGFKLQKIVYTKTFMWDWDSMAPRLGTPIHHHFQDEAWMVVAGEGMFRVLEKRHRIVPGDFIFVPGGVKHQIANLSHTEPLVYQVVLAPPVTLDSIIIDEDFDESHLEGI